MALARVKTWNAGDTLTAADLNAEYNNILNNPTSLINLSGAGDLAIVSSAAAVTRLAIGTSGQVLTVSTGLLPVWSASATATLQSYIAGCQITAMTVSSSGTITHSSGTVTDSSNVLSITLSSALVGTTTGAFVAGNNQPKLQVSPLAASTSYLIYIISSSVGGSADVLYSSSTSPTLPAGYVRSRRIGAFITTSTGGLRQMVQDGETFVFTTGTILDVNSNNPGTGAVNRTLTVPTGMSVFANINVNLVDGTNIPLGYISDLSAADEAPSQTAAPLVTFGAGAAQNASGVFPFSGYIRTSTGGQVRSRISVSGAGSTLYIATLGWRDQLGRLL